MKLEDMKNKAEDLKRRVYWKKEDLKDKAKQHKDEIIGYTVVFGPLVALACLEISKQYIKAKAVKEVTMHRERDIYDPYRGHYYRAKRKIKNSEWLAIDTRYSCGESYGQILRDMHLL